MMIVFPTVLVAHNGYSFDYRIMLAEMERHKVDNRWFELHNVHFADSLHYLRQVRLKLLFEITVWNFLSFIPP